MLEPVALVLHHLGHSSALNVATNSMKRSVRITVGPDFFSPQPRRASHGKGKAKATGFQEMDECLLSPISLCHQWSFSARQLFVTHKQSRVPDVETPDESASRRPSLTPVRLTIHQYSSRRPPLRVSGQRRHVSGLPDVGTPSPIDPNDRDDEPENVASTSPDPRQRFVRALESAVSAKTFSTKACSRAWAAYVAVKEHDALDIVDVQILLTFARRIIAFTKKARRHASDRTERPTTSLGTLPQNVREWGDRLIGLLDSAKSRIPPYSSRLAHLHRCLLARSHMLKGNINDAMQVLDELSKMRGRSSQQRSVYLTILSFMHRSKGVTKDMLDWIILHWDVIGDHLTSVNVKHDLAFSEGVRIKVSPDVADVPSFRSAVHSILSEVPRPLNLLKDLNDGCQQAIGELFIQAMCSVNRHQPAFLILLYLFERDAPPHPHVHCVLVRSLVKQEAMANAKQAFALLRDIVDDKAYLSTGLYLFGHDGDHKRARHFFDRLEEQSLVTREDRANLLHAYASKGLASETVDIFNSIFPIIRTRSNGQIVRFNDPRSNHFAEVLYAYVQAGDIAGLNDWLIVMNSSGIKPNVVIFTMTLKAFVKTGDMDSIMAILGQMRKAGIAPTVATYTSLLTALARRRDPISAEAMFRLAVKEGISPNRRMMNALMTAHVEAGSWQGVIRAFDYMSSTLKIDMTIESYNTLFKAYVAIGMPFPIIARLFQKIKSSSMKPDRYTYALVIQAACDNKMMSFATALFDEMEGLLKDWKEHMEITVYVMTIMMGGWLRLGNREQGKAIYEDMTARGMDPTSVTFVEIMRAYTLDTRKSADSIALAEQFIEDIISTPHDQRTWIVPPWHGKTSMDHIYAPLMWAYSRQKRPEDVERLLKHMLKNGGETTVGTLTALLDVYRRTENVSGAITLWPHIFELGLRQTEMPVTDVDDDGRSTLPRRIQADLLCPALSIYITMLSHAGLFSHIADAWKSFQETGLMFNSHNYNHLILALVRAGELERAFQILDRVILPFSRKFKTLRRVRPTQPDSPLIFDDKLLGIDEDGLPTPPPQRVDASGQRRGEIKTNRHYLREINVYPDDAEDDLAAPLWLMQQISPGWNYWAPHSVVLSTLLVAVLRLREGLLREALSLHKPPNSLPQRSRLELAQERVEAAALLERIQDKFPQAYLVILDWESKERNRFSTKKFEQKYIQQVMTR